MLLFILISMLSVFAYTDLTILNGTKAYVDSEAGYLEQEPYLISQDDEAKIRLSNKLKVGEYDLCFDFPINNEHIYVDYIKQKKLFLDTNLNELTRDGNRICIKSFTSSTEEELYYKMSYSGSDTIKYNVTLIPSKYSKDYSTAKSEMVVLDPYLIGNLSEYNNLVFHTNFDSNIIDSSIHYQDNILNNTMVQSTITTGTELIRNMSVNDFVKSYTANYYYATVNEYDVEIAFIYSDNTSYTTPTQHIGEPLNSWRNLTFNNTFYGKKVSNILSYLIVTGSNYNETNISILRYKENLSTAYILDNGYGNMGYIFSVNRDSTDIFNEYNGITIGSISYDYNGINFTGYNNSIIIENDLSQSSLNLFFKGINIPDDNGGFPRLLSNEKVGDPSFIRIYSHNERYYFQVIDGGSNNCSITTPTLNVSQEYDFYFGFNTTHCYVNIDNEWFISIQESSNPSGYGNQTAFSIGSYNIDPSKNGYWDGSIKSLFIYNYTLTNSELSKLFNDGLYTTNVLGESNSSLSFNGINEYLRVQNNDILNFSNYYTISLWIKSNMLNQSNAGLIWKQGDYYLYLNNGYLNLVTFNTFGFASIANISENLISTNKWNNIIAIYNGTNSKLYLNGINVGVVGSTLSGKIRQISNNISIGKIIEYETYNPFNGSIDEILIFNYVLSDDEIKQLANGFNNSINLSIYNLNTNELITDDTITIELLNLDKDYSTIYTTTDGYLFINGVPEGDLTITSYGNLYNSNIVVYDINTINSQYDIDIYLTNKTDSSAGKLFTYTLDENYYAIKGADVRLQQFFPEEGDFKEIDQCYTDSNGECVFDIILSTKKYIITSQKIIDGSLLTTSSSDIGNFYNIDNTEIELYLRKSYSFELPDDFDLFVNATNTTLVNNISYLSAYFYDPYLNTHNVCIKYEWINGTNMVDVDEHCVNSSSGTVNIIGGKLLNLTYTYVATIFTKDDSGNIDRIYYTFRYEKDTGFSTIFSIYVSIIVIVLMAILLGASLMLGNIYIFSLGMIPISILGRIIDPTSFSTLIVTVIIILCIGISYVARKKNDNEAT